MIVGAGLAGLIAAHIFPRESIVEAAAQPLQAHKALLRFRTEAVSKVTGIPFKQVTVRKGIYYDDEFHQPNIQLANMYSRKCLGRIVGDRSIWSLDPVQRFIAPDDFYCQLLDAVGSRIQWGREIDFNLAKHCESPFISTAPLPVVLASLGEPVPADIEFVRAPITVARYHIEGCDAYQTIYFPSGEHSLYRASITGSMLICEFIGEPDTLGMSEMERAFDLCESSARPLEKVKQSYGKIAPIDTGIRKRLVHKLTVEHNIFSLGRFATWRNLLLDDVVDDAWIVKRLITQSEYDRQLHAL